MMFGLINMKNYRGSNKLSRVYRKIISVKFYFKLFPVNTLHKSSEDVIQPSKWSREPNREWHVNAALTNKP